MTENQLHLWPQGLHHAWLKRCEPEVKTAIGLAVLLPTVLLVEAKAGHGTPEEARAQPLSKGDFACPFALCSEVGSFDSLAVKVLKAMLKSETEVDLLAFAWIEDQRVGPPTSAGGTRYERSTLQ